MVFLLALQACMGDFEKDNPLNLNDSAGGAGPQGEYADFGGERSRLLGGEWVLETMGGTPVNGITVLEFKTQRNLAGNYILSGISTVNFYEAGYRLNGTDRLKIVTLSTTQLAGQPRDLAFEKEYFDQLVAVTAFAFKEKRLILKNERGAELVFKSAKTFYAGGAR